MRPVLEKIDKRWERAESLSVDPKRAVVCGWYNRYKVIEKGQNLLHQGKYKKAVDLYKKELKKTNKDLKYNIYNGLGNCYRCLGEHNKAIKYYKKAIENKPKSLPKGLYWSNTSFCYAQLKKWDKAIETAKKASNLLKKEEEKEGIKHGNQLKILDLEIKLYKEYKKRD